MISRSFARTCRCLLVVSGVAAPLGALAQTAPQTPPPAAPQAAPTQAAPPTATPIMAQPQLDKRSAARVEARIAQLHSLLHITAAEQGRWDAFTAIMRQNAAHTDDILALRGDPSKRTALEDMGNYTAIAVAHAADMQKLLPAFEDLYNSMSPQQQRQTDAVFRQEEERRRR
jgi:5,10-methylenetetrahydrofolate reductase